MNAGIPVDFLTAQKILTIISAAVCAAIIAAAPFRKKSIIQKAGKRLFSAKRKGIVQPALVMLFCVAMLALLFLRNVGLSAHIILCLASVLGTAIGAGDAITRDICGIYSNGIIGAGRFIPISEICGVPILQDAPDEQEYENALNITTCRRGRVTLVYDSKEERAAALEALLSAAPELQR